MTNTDNKILHILVTIIFVVMLGIGLSSVYKNHIAQQKDLQENYIKTEAEITFVGRTGTGFRTKALLMVSYSYGNQNYKGRITRTYKEEGYYKKGSRITINLNPNNPEDIR